MWRRSAAQQRGDRGSGRRARGDDEDEGEASTHSHMAVLLKGLRKAAPPSTPKGLPLRPDLLNAAAIQYAQAPELPSQTNFLRYSEFTASNFNHHPSRYAIISIISIHSPNTIVYHLSPSTSSLNAN
ncbi:hypothetical protein EYF80_007284 [Liparis tanakae]|uniref:Uncharacterized protein n=1 Tax=Liparis tanakae TaxID=230148 RepID=A0A4Z2IWT1_9TELE|nr:hypothetical protein EYF80_007284 [Liparis tanakae]